MAASVPYPWLCTSWLWRLLTRSSVLLLSSVPGNDDYGTMSAWQLWAYMGLYPVAGMQCTLHRPATNDVGALSVLLSVLLSLSVLLLAMLSVLLSVLLSV